MTADPFATILCMEDDDTVRQAVVAYLEDRGFTVVEAENGRVGLEKFRSQKPDLILVDLRMPEMDGLHVLSEVTKESPDTPLIVVSGTGVIADAVEALHLGAWDYVLKPIEDMAVLRHAVEKSLERARLIRWDREYQHRLEKEVQQRTAQFRAANLALRREIEERKRAESQREELISRLEAQNAELERYAYTVSHDLKTPLITLKGYMGALREDIASDDRPAVEDDLKRMSSAADTMAELLYDLLELSRIGHLVNPPQEVALQELAQEAIALVATRIEQQGVQIEVSSQLPVVLCDRPRVLEVLQNLIDNAVKYMGDQAEPRVEIGARPMEDQSVCFVRDNGIGIDPRYHHRIFGLFEQVHRTAEGSGVGLALAKRIVELHNGRIWVESDGEGQGATFCFTLPQVPNSDRSEAAGESASGR